jgi:cobalt-zinc-cadmium efflux system membrane fusion protein
MDYVRAKDLYEHRAVSEKDLYGAQNDLMQAKANAETSRAVSEQALRKLELLGLQPNEFRQATLVRAPLSGRVLEINVTPGEYRGAVSSHSDTTTAPLMTVADLSTVWMSSDVPEPSIRLIRVGEEVQITLVAFPGEILRGRVARIADTLDPQTRTLKVHVDLPNPAGRFRPEMFGSIRHSGNVRPRPVVPLSAIVQEYGQSLVFLERGPGRFERRQVATGPSSGDDVVPILSGLQADDRVVVGGAILLKGQ